MEKEYITNISQRIIEKCYTHGFEPDTDEIKRKVQRLIEEFGVSPVEVEKLLCRNATIDGKKSGIIDRKI